MVADSLYHGFVAFTRRRVFVNSALGCPSRCSYCYIKDYGVGDRPVLAAFSGDSLGAYLRANGHFVPGRTGDLLSFGCFTESFHSRTAGKTLELIRAAAELGNPIQVATKQELSTATVRWLATAQCYPGQISVFVSVTTLLRWKSIEPGTAPPSRRLRTIRRAREVGLPACLYVKPFLVGVTDHELPVFKEAISEFRPTCLVVGNLYTSSRIEERIVGFTQVSEDYEGVEPFPVPGQAELKEAYPESVLASFEEHLACGSETVIFRHSSDAVRYLIGTAQTAPID